MSNNFEKYLNNILNNKNVNKSFQNNNVFENINNK